LHFINSLHFNFNHSPQKYSIIINIKLMDLQILFSKVALLSSSVSSETAYS